MRHHTKRLSRLVAAMAVISTILVPTAMAGAGEQGPPNGSDPGPSGVFTNECDGGAYHASNPDHILYGRTEGTPVDPTTNKMVLDMRGFGPPQGNRYVVFWDGHFTESTLPVISVSDGVYIEGSRYNDTICGTSGNDIIYGRMGNDRIFGSGANGSCPTTSSPGTPGDRLFGNRGNDFITPGRGTGQHQTGASTNTTVGGGRDNDTLYAGDGHCTLTRGGQGNDFLYGALGDADDPVLRGGTGNDWIWAGNGFNTNAYGNAGDDVLIAANGTMTTLHGNRGNDHLYGGGADYQRLFGGAGDDTLVASSVWRVALFGGQGNDLLRTCYYGEAGTLVIQPTPGDPGYPLCSVRTAGYWGFGGPGDDVVIGSGDLFVGGAFNGGDGAVDTDDFSEALGGGNATRMSQGDCLWGDMPYDSFELELCTTFAGFPATGNGVCEGIDAPLVSCVVVDTPSDAEGAYPAAHAFFGLNSASLSLLGDELSSSFEVVDDGSADPTFGCGPLVGFTPGAIAVVDRGDCAFTVKAANAQDAGAIAVIAINDVDVPEYVNMGGTDPSITIPLVMLSQADGAALVDGLPATGTVRAAFLSPSGGPAFLYSGLFAGAWNDASAGFRMAFPVNATASGNDVVVGGGVDWSEAGRGDFLFGGPGDDLLYSFGINGYLPEQYAALAGSPESADMDSGGYNGRTSAGPVSSGDITYWPVAVSFGNDGNDTHFSHCISGSVAHPVGNSADGGAGTAPLNDTSHQYWGDNSGSYLARVEHINDQCGVDNGNGFFTMPPFISGEWPTP